MSVRDASRPRSLSDPDMPREFVVHLSVVVVFRITEWHCPKYLGKNLSDAFKIKMLIV